MSKIFGTFVLCCLFTLGCSGGGDKETSNNSNDGKSKSTKPKERSEEEKKAIKAIEGLGGKVVYDISVDSKPVFEINFADSKVKDADLVHLKAFAGLEMVNLMDTAVTDDGLMQLASIKTLQEVRVAGSKVSVDGAKNLKDALPNCIVSRDR